MSTSSSSYMSSSSDEYDDLHSSSSSFASSSSALHSTSTPRRGGKQTSSSSSSSSSSTPPAYPGAPFDVRGFCVSHSTVRLARVSPDQQYKVCRKICPKCLSGLGGAASNNKSAAGVKKGHGSASQSLSSGRGGGGRSVSSGRSGRSARSQSSGRSESRSQSTGRASRSGDGRRGRSATPPTGGGRRRGSSVEGKRRRGTSVERHRHPRRSSSSSVRSSGSNASSRGAGSVPLPNRANRPSSSSVRSSGSSRTGGDSKKRYMDEEPRWSSALPPPGTNAKASKQSKSHKQQGGHYVEQLQEDDVDLYSVDSDNSGHTGTSTLSSRSDLHLNLKSSQGGGIVVGGPATTANNNKGARRFSTIEEEEDESRGSRSRGGNHSRASRASSRGRGGSRASRSSSRGRGGRQHPSAGGGGSRSSSRRRSSSSGSRNNGGGGAARTTTPKDIVVIENSHPSAPPVEGRVVSQPSSSPVVVRKAGPLFDDASTVHSTSDGDGLGAKTNTNPNPGSVRKAGPLYNDDSFTTLDFGAKTSTPNKMNPVRKAGPLYNNDSFTTLGDFGAKTTTNQNESTGSVRKAGPLYNDDSFTTLDYYGDITTPKKKKTGSITSSSSGAVVRKAGPLYDDASTVGGASTAQRPQPYNPVADAVGYLNQFGSSDASDLFRQQQAQEECPDNASVVSDLRGMNVVVPPGEQQVQPRNPFDDDEGSLLTREHRRATATRPASSDRRSSPSSSGPQRDSSSSSVRSYNSRSSSRSKQRQQQRRQEFDRDREALVPYQSRRSSNGEDRSDLLTKAKSFNGGISSDTASMTSSSSSGSSASSSDNSWTGSSIARSALIDKVDARGCCTRHPHVQLCRPKAQSHRGNGGGDSSSVMSITSWKVVRKVCPECLADLGKTHLKRTKSGDSAKIATQLARHSSAGSGSDASSPNNSKNSNALVLVVKDQHGNESEVHQVSRTHSRSDDASDSQRPQLLRHISSLFVEPHDPEDDDEEHGDEETRRLVLKLAARSYHLPGNESWCDDWIQYVRNTHPVFGIFFHHPLHPLRMKERLIILFGSIASGLSISNLIFLYFVNSGLDTDDEVFVMNLGSKYTGFPDVHVTNQMLTLWTLGSSLHAVFDLSLWHIAACKCLRHGGRVSQRALKIGQSMMVAMVLAVVALASWCVLVRASIESRVDQDYGTYDPGEVTYDDQIGTWHTEVDIDGKSSFKFLLGYLVELVLALFVYYMLGVTVLFSGVLGCGKLPVLGGRPRELRRERRYVEEQEQRQKERSERMSLSSSSSSLPETSRDTRLSVIRDDEYDGDVADEMEFVENGEYQMV